jgi:cyclophilin family peptidyl-prolyl cis-trans isomerase/HEAT repeat protein
MARLRWSGLLALIVAGGAAPVAAQTPARDSVLVDLLAAEDARSFDSVLVGAAVRHPDPLVRRRAALAAGRIRDPRATPLLLPLLQDARPSVQADAAFALGLLGDSSAADALAARVRGAPDSATAAELVTALAKLPGARAATALGRLVEAGAPRTPGGRGAVAAALLESWRLRDRAPGAALVRASGSSDGALRARAIYSLARLRAPEAGAALLAALADRRADVRAYAARALSRGYAEKAGLPLDSTPARLAASAGDADPGVRVNALLALGSYRDSSRAPLVLPRLQDPALNVRVQAATALGQLGGAQAATALAALADDGAQPWAVRREALIGLARADTARFAAAARAWRRSADWRDRAAAAEGWVVAGRDTQRGLPDWLDDPEPRVVAWGLQAWTGVEEGADSSLVAAARPRLASPDAAVRSLAADVLARAADPTDAPALAAMYAAAGRDSFPQAALSALAALSAIAKRSDSARALVATQFADHVPRADDYLLRGWAARNWPELSTRWGPAHPIATGHDRGWYSALVRRFVVGPVRQRAPRVRFETEHAGSFEVELLGEEAPVTVAHFLEFVDAGFFRGHRWHRVVPNFVVQDGDPRGDGWGGPPGAIRDEINRVRYGGPVLGMALDGPDTGNSQWFVNLSPQPHLDGTYTVFGRVIRRQADLRALARITQGDRILRVVRVGPQ